MLSVLTIPEALAQLRSKTGREWTDSHFFDAVCRLRLVLRAAPPQDATTELWVFKERVGYVVKDFGDGLMVCGMPWRMAVLHPADVQILWQAGEIDISEAANGRGVQGEREERELLGAQPVGALPERWRFTRPVRVTHKMARVTPWVLDRIVEFANRSPEFVTAEVTPASVATVQVMAPLMPIESEGRPSVAGAVVHAAKRRADPLGVVIRNAIEGSGDPGDWCSGWTALVALASGSDRSAPLLGYSEGEGVKYHFDHADEPVRWLSRDAFKKRHKRMSSPPSPGRDRT